MEFYPTEILDDSSINSSSTSHLNLTCSTPPLNSSNLINYQSLNPSHSQSHSQPQSQSQSQNFKSSTYSIQPQLNSSLSNIFQTQRFHSVSDLLDCNSIKSNQLINSNDYHHHHPNHQINQNHHQLNQTLSSNLSGPFLQPSPLSLTDSQPINQLEFQFDKSQSISLSSTESISKSNPLNLNLNLNFNDDNISNSILNSSQTTTNLVGIDGLVNGNDLTELSIQSNLGSTSHFIGFDTNFGFQDGHSDNQIHHENSNSNQISSSHLNHHQIYHHHPSQINLQHQNHHITNQKFPSSSSSLDDDHHQNPLSPNQLVISPSSPHFSHQSNLYFTPPSIYRYTNSTPIPLEIDLNNNTPVMFRNGSTTSEFSTGSSNNSTGVNPIHINSISQPMTPQDDLFIPLTDPFQPSWWPNQNDNKQVESLVSKVRVSIGLSSNNDLEHDHSDRISSIFPQSLTNSSSSPGTFSSLQLSSPYNLSNSSIPPPHSPLSHTPLSQPLTNKSRKNSNRSLINPSHRSPTKISSRAFLIEPDYSRLPTKRSRGRRPPISPDLGIPIPDGRLSIGLQSVPGGQAFDPNLNPNAETVKYCELTKTGKPKKIFICQVTGCGKCFKRSEHLKRHVRSIHTNDKPYNCPWMTCMKSFSRHDNLNQHLRVHRVEEGGHVLDGLHIGSDGVLRSDLDESPVEPILRGLKNVEVIDRYIIDD